MQTISMLAFSKGCLDYGVVLIMRDSLFRIGWFDCRRCRVGASGLPPRLFRTIQLIG